MEYGKRWFVVILLIFSALLAACGSKSTYTKIEPAVVEAIDGTELNRVTLTQKAFERLDIQTDEVRDTQVDGASRKVIPYSALLYDVHGGTWAYVNPEPLTFMRAEITVDHIDGDDVFLTAGPDSGTAVVTVGAAELFGTDTGVGK